jgi:superfamily II DNA/RNA helicase
VTKRSLRRTKRRPTVKLQTSRKKREEGGGFQAMGLNANLLKAITRKGFSVPTPIQRKTIPLVLDAQDVVGMARTGSGKTAALLCR